MKGKGREPPSKAHRGLSIWGEEKGERKILALAQKENRFRAEALDS